MSPGEKRNVLTALGFLALPLVFYTIFVIAPVVQAAHFSLYRWNGLGPLTDFVGITNFRQILADDVFRTAVVNNLLIVILSLLLELPLALVIAVAIGRRFKGSVIFRTIFFRRNVIS